MSSGVVAYRLRATARRRIGGHLAIVLLVALLGGTAMAAIAAARRTQSSFAAFLASTNPSDLTMTTYGIVPGSPANGYSMAVAERLAHLPGVVHVESWAGPLAAPLLPDGAPNLAVESNLNNVGSIDGLYFDQDRATPVAGRLARPDRPDEFVTTALGAHLLGLKLGASLPMGFYDQAQGALPGFGTARVPPVLRVKMTLVGIVVLNDGVVQDQVDQLPASVVFTPALTRAVLAHPGSTAGSWYGFRLAKGASIAAVEREAAAVVPQGGITYFRAASLNTAKVERAVKPEAVALAVFGAIAAAATLAIAGLAISRQQQADDADRAVLRSLGAGPLLTVADGLVGTVGAVVLGTLLACAVAVAASPLAPAGPVRRVYATRGVAVDWTVLGAGVVLLVGGLGAAAALLAVLRAPARAARKAQAQPGRGSSVARLAAASGVPAPAVVGMRLALEPGRGRTAVPVRSVLAGSVLAVVVVVATLTFGSSLRTLVSRPALYGWNWDYALQSTQNVPPQSRAVLDSDRLVAAWAPYIDLNVDIDGQSVPVLVGPTDPAVTPPILSGHAVAGADQVVLGESTLHALHKHIDDTVLASFGTPSQAPLYIPPTRLEIVGTATLPAVEGSGALADHTTMGTGGLLSMGIASAAFVQAGQGRDPTLNGPPLVFVRLVHGVGAAAGLADMQRAADAGNKAFAADPNGGGDVVNVLTVQRPAEIVNYRATGATPLVLACGLAFGAVVALGLTLAASVRRRRRELALLKTLGFTRRQLRATVACQATVAAVVGVLGGVPLGIALGRQLWDVFAREISAVPHPTVPLSVVVVAAGAVVLANVVAALPGRVAARTPAALVLRAE